MRIRHAYVWLLLGGLWACPSTGAKDEAVGAADDKAAQPASKPAAPKVMPKIELPPGDGPAAMVNGKEVPRDAFNAEYRQTLERYQRARHEVKPPLRERLKDNIMKRLVDAELIRQKALELGVEVPEAELKLKWSKHKERYGTEEGFQSFLERAGTTAQDVERQFRANLLREKVFAKVAETVRVTSDEVRKFYQDNPKRFEDPERVRASHILVRTAKGADKAAMDAALEKSKAALKLVKKGTAFADVAREFSDDNTKDRGGDLGFFTKGRMLKPFEDAVWKLKVGGVAGPVKSRFGYHVIKKTGHQKSKRRPFEEVSQQIERSLQARARNQAIRDALEGWKKEATIDVHIQGDPEIINQGRPALPANMPGRPGRPPIDVKKLPPPTTDDRPTGD